MDRSSISELFDIMRLESIMHNTFSSPIYPVWESRATFKPKHSLSRASFKVKHSLCFGGVMPKNLSKSGKRIVYLLYKKPNRKLWEFSAGRFKIQT